MRPVVWLALLVLLAVGSTGLIAWNPAPDNEDEQLICPVSGLADEGERPSPCGPAGVTPEEAETRADELADEEPGKGNN